jgi:hypothetical protein
MGPLILRSASEVCRQSAGCDLSGISRAFLRRNNRTIRPLFPATTGMIRQLLSRSSGRRSVEESTQLVVVQLGPHHRPVNSSGGTVIRGGVGSMMVDERCTLRDNVFGVSVNDVQPDQHCSCQDGNGGGDHLIAAQRPRCLPALLGLFTLTVVWFCTTKPDGIIALSLSYFGCRCAGNCRLVGVRQVQMAWAGPPGSVLGQSESHAEQN